MNWLTKLVRPRIRALVAKKEVPEHLWRKCPNCGQMIFHRELEANLLVCPHCDHHMRLRAAQRCAFLFDGGAYSRIELPKTPVDPLKFRDLRRYAERLKESQAETGEQDAVIVAHGKMGGMPVVVAHGWAALAALALLAAAGLALVAHYEHGLALDRGALAHAHLVLAAYGFLGLGLALYFSSQGVGRMLWPLSSGVVRLTGAVLGSWALVHGLGVGLPGIFAMLALGMALFGTLIGSGSAVRVFYGYLIAAVLMFGAAVVEIVYGVKAERIRLEAIASPLSTER